MNQRGWGPGWIENLDSLGKRTLNSTSSPAHPGQRVALRITGLGKDAGATLVIGDRNVLSGLPRTLAAPGEQEVSFPIPLEVPSGCYVPVYFQGSTGKPSNVVTMAIHSGPGNCDPGPIPLLDKQRVGVAVFTRSNMLDGVTSTTADEVIAVFAAKSEGPALSPLLLLPPPGTCTAYMSSFQTETIMPDSIASALIAEVVGEGLAAGSELGATQGKNHPKRSQGTAARPAIIAPGWAPIAPTEESCFWNPADLFLAARAERMSDPLAYPWKARHLSNGPIGGRFSGSTATMRFP